MRIVRHRLTDADYIPSPNHDARPDANDINLLVVHCISLPPEEFGGNYIDQLFCNCLDPDQHPYFKEIAHLRVSAHILIKRDGHCHQYVDFDERAWHAGVSEFEGRARCNDFSIGIELEGSVNQTYTNSQYQQLAKLTKLLIDHYPNISRNRIVGHSDIAPGRKNDPGPFFDWTYYQQLLEQEFQ